MAVDNGDARSYGNEPMLIHMEEIGAKTVEKFPENRGKSLT